MKRIYLQLLSIFITFLSAIYMLLGSFGIKLNDIAELSKTKWDYNIDVAKSLVQQQIDTKISICLLLFSLLLQFLALKYPLENNNKIFQIKPILLIIGISVILYMSLNLVSNRITTITVNKVENILKIEAKTNN